jgi:hypothetical protein
MPAHGGRRRRTRAARADPPRVHTPSSSRRHRRPHRGRPRGSFPTPSPPGRSATARRPSHESVVAVHRRRGPSELEPHPTSDPAPPRARRRHRGSCAAALESSQGPAPHSPPNLRWRGSSRRAPTIAAITTSASRPQRLRIPSPYARTSLLSLPASLRRSSAAPQIELPAPDTPPLLLRRRWRDPSCGGSSVRNRQRPPLICIRGERACIFSSPLSSDANCVPSVPPLLEKESTMHRDGGEAKMHLHIVVGVSLNKWCRHDHGAANSPTLA